MTRLTRQDFVVKDGKVQCKAKTNRVSRRQVRRGNTGGCLVGIKSSRSRSLSVISSLKFRKVSVVITLHFVVKDFGFFRSRVWNERILDNAQDIVADVDKFLCEIASVNMMYAVPLKTLFTHHLTFNLGLVLLNDNHFVRFALLLYRWHDTPRSTTRTNHILVSNRKEITLLHRKLHLRRRKSNG